MANQRIKGQCPRGCGETLFVGEGGYITCSYIDCPQPDAAAELLDKGRRFLAFIRDDSRLLSISENIDQPPNNST